MSHAFLDFADAKLSEGHICLSSLSFSFIITVGRWKARSLDSITIISVHLLAYAA